MLGARLQSPQVRQRLPCARCRRLTWDEDQAGRLAGLSSTRQLQFWRWQWMACQAPQRWIVRGNKPAGSAGPAPAPGWPTGAAQRAVRRGCKRRLCIFFYNEVDPHDGWVQLVGAHVGALTGIYLRGGHLSGTSSTCALAIGFLAWI